MAGLAVVAVVALVAAYAASVVFSGGAMAAAAPVIVGACAAIIGAAAVTAKGLSDYRNKRNSSYIDYINIGLGGAAMGAIAGFAIVAAPLVAEKLAFQAMMTVPLRPFMIPIITGGASTLTYGLAFSNLLFRHFDTTEFATGQNHLKAFMCEVLGPERGLSVYNTSDGAVFAASIIMIFAGAAISKTQANSPKDVAKNAALQSSEYEGGSDVLDANVQSEFERLLNSDYYKSDFGYDCSEIAEDFYNATGKQGTIYRIEGKNGVINGYEYNNVVEYIYHEVYSDGVYIYDPRYRNVPILKDDYFRALREINPDGFNVFTITLE